MTLPRLTILGLQSFFKFLPHSRVFLEFSKERMYADVQS